MERITTLLRYVKRLLFKKKIPKEVLRIVEEDDFFMKALDWEQHYYQIGNCLLPIANGINRKAL